MGSILTEEAQNGARLGVVIGDCLNHSETSEYHCSNLWNMSGTSEFGLVQGFADDAERVPAFAVELIHRGGGNGRSSRF